MVTWLQLWWELLIPFIVISLLVTLPTIQWSGHLIGGGPLREWLLNQCVLPWLPTDMAHTLVQWWMSATTFQEISLSMLIALNINVVLLPVMYLQGELIIRYRAWAAAKSLDLLRHSIRR